MKITYRVLLAYEKVAYDENGEEIYEINQNWVYNKNAQNVVKHNIKSVVEDQIKETVSKLEKLDIIDGKGKPLGSGWKIISLDQLNVDI